MSIRIAQAPKDELCSITSTHRIIKDLGSEKINYREVQNSEADQSYIIMNIASEEILSILREQLISTDYSLAFAISTIAAMIAAISAMIF